MPAESDHKPDDKMNDLLKAYAKKRQDEADSGFELHPATRQLLQSEISKLRSRPTAGARSWISAFLYWPRTAGLAATVLVLGIAYWGLVSQQTPTEPVQTSSQWEFASDISERSSQDEPAVMQKDAQPTAAPSLTRIAPSKNAQPSEEIESRRDNVRGGSELTVANKAELKTITPVDSLSDEKRAVKLGKHTAHAPALAREPDIDLAIPKSLKLDSVDHERISSPSLPAQASNNVSPDGSESLVGFAKAKEVEVLLRSAASVQNRETVPPSTIQLESEKSFAELMDSSGAQPNASATNNGFGALSSFSLNRPTLVSGDFFSRTLAEANTAGYRTNSALGLAYTDGARLTAFSNSSSQAGLSAARRPADLAMPGQMQTASSPQRYQRLNESNTTEVQAGLSGRRFRQRQLATEPVPSGPNTPTVFQVLSSFEFQQNGERARVIDADGSVYEGQVGIAPIEATAGSATKPASASQSVPLNEVQRNKVQESRLSRVVTQSGSQASPTQFRLAGTNQTLGLIVHFEGSLVNGNVDFETQKKLEGKKVEQDRLSASQTRAEGVQSQVPAQQIRGMLRIGNSNAVPIDAVPTGN